MNGATKRMNSTLGPAGVPPGSARREPLAGKRRRILEFISAQLQERGYPPSVREIGEAVGLASPSSVHTHLEILQREGYLRRDPSKPRAIEIRHDVDGAARRRPGVTWESDAGEEEVSMQRVPLVGDVAAGTDVLASQNVEEMLPLPQGLVGSGDLFALRVRGESMQDAGIFPGDLVVVRAQSQADPGDVVVAGIPGDEATVKTYRRSGAKIVLEPANAQFAPMEFEPGDVTVYGKVVTLLRQF